MSNPRKVRKVSESRPTMEGAGVRLRRAFGFGATSLTDPFLLLDDFRGDSPADYIKGFPWHPHRGIETITWMLEGTVEHGDSMGNSGTIGPGDAQWMTAGSGIIHQEMPQPGPGGRMGGFQLWANLPARDKMMDPRYRDITRKDIPVVETGDGARVRVLCGEVDGTRGPVRDVVIDPLYIDVEMRPGARFAMPTPVGHTVFAYVFQGRVRLGEQEGPHADGIASEHLVVFDDGDGFVASTGESAARFLLVAGRPLREPVAWYGPIVMNTQEELEKAFEEYRNGTFIRKR
jgi:quercetin 2,3-dioxygenase